MFTLFAIPKAFKGHDEIIQRNAFESWRLLGPSIEIMILGDDAGTAEVAAEYGFRHIPFVRRNEHGTPMLDDLFQQAQKHASHNYLCYINSDIIIAGGFLESAEAVIRHFDRFLMVGQRWDLDIRNPFDFSRPDWQSRLRSQCATEGTLHYHSGIDYFFFSPGIYEQMPPLILGRIAWDNWLVVNARRMGAAVIDATEMVFAVHQNHEYKHVKGGRDAAWHGPEAQYNRALTGMKGGNEGYIQNAASWRLLPGAFTPAVRAQKSDPRQVAMSLFPNALEEATSLLEKGKPSQALRKLEPLLPYSDFLEQYHYMMAVVFSHLGQWDEAQQACLKELQRFPNFQPAKDLLKTIEPNLKLESSKKPAQNHVEQPKIFENSSSASVSNAKSSHSEQNSPFLQKKVFSSLVPFIDQHRFYTNQVYLNDSDYTGLRVLEISTLPRTSFSWILKTRETVSLRLPNHDSSHDVLSANNVKLQNGELEQLPFEDSSFDMIAVYDLHPLVKNLKHAISELSRIAKQDGLLLIAAKIDPDMAVTQSQIITQFESQFVVELEEHLEIAPDSINQSLEASEKYYMENKREGIVIAKLRRVDEVWSTMETAPPFRLEGNCVAERFTELSQPSAENINKEKIATNVSREKLENNPDSAIKGIRESIDRQYEMLYNANRTSKK